MTQPGDSSRSFRFSSGGKHARLLGKLSLARSHVAAGVSLSQISLSVLEEAVSHFLAEAGLGEVSRERRVASFGDSSTNRRFSGDGGRSGPDQERTARRQVRAWQNDEDARQRLSARLKTQISHEEISLEEDTSDANLGKV